MVKVMTRQSGELSSARAECAEPRSVSYADQNTSKIFGILLTFRRQSLLPDALRKILSQTRWVDQLLVVDNENSAATKAIVEQFYREFPKAKIQYVATPQNLGSAGGWAFGMQRVLEVAADGDWILPLDDDDPPRERHDVERIAEFARTMERQVADLGAVGIIGARLMERDGRVLRLPDGELRGPVSVDWVGTGNLPLYKVAAVRRAGVFDHRLFFGHTEMEFGLRLRSHGFRIFAHGEMWKERRGRCGQLGMVKPRSLVCRLRWEQYYSIRNYIYIMKRLRRWDIVVKYVAVQCIAKPLWTAFVKPSHAIPGLRVAVRACWDGLVGRMGCRVEPGA
jgi:GT2 family glycosyltransferase